jgi:hypothetical protein
MTERRQDHGAVAASIRRAGTPCQGPTRVAIVVRRASWRVAFGSRTDSNRGRRDRNGAARPEAAVALRAPFASGPTAPSDEPTAHPATNRPMTLTEHRQVVGDAPLLILRRQK